MSAFLENAMCNTGEGERSGETKKKKKEKEEGKEKVIA